MRWRHVAVLVGLLLAAASGAAADVTIQDFSGDWRGAELRTSGDDKGLQFTPEDLDVQIRGNGDGFHMTWTGFSRQDGGELTRQKTEASFTPTDRPGVYAFDPGGVSLLSRLFADPATGNPLTGETLLWARLVGPTLTVYSLAIDSHGGFDLERYARTLTDEGMTVRYTRRIENDLILTIEGRLGPAGG
ncbi:MAG TPA: hypothetical protein VLE23_06130 [Geminicoccaceae bacterium]|nr:hypothetical protein [Geminicoccaceae bacterium]